MSTHNPFAYPKPITLETLPDLFTHHAGLTAGWRMEDEPPKGDGDPPKGGGQDDPPKFEPITSQEELDRRIGPRLAREREKYADYEELKKVKAERDAEIEAARTDHEKAVDAARKEGESTALERANARVVRAEAKAAAGGRFHDPEVAVRLLNLSDVKVGEDGSVDAAVLKTKLDALAAEHPYLVNEGKSKPKSDPSQGGDDGGNERTRGGSVAEVMAERRAARAEKKTANS